MAEKQSVEICDKVAWRIIDGEAVVISLEEPCVRGLNPLATKIWELLDKKITVDEITKVISNEYDVSPTQAKNDVDELLGKLEERKLISRI